MKKYVSASDSLRSGQLDRMMSKIKDHGKVERESISKMKRIYVAGPYSADNVLDVLRNIGRGQMVCAKLFISGYAPFCPWHDKTYVFDNFDRDLSVGLFYDYSNAWLEVSDAVLVLPDSDLSIGTQGEIRRARELDIPVFRMNDIYEDPKWVLRNRPYWT